MMQQLAALPMIEVKTAQTVFKLPLEGFADALAASRILLRQPQARRIRRRRKHRRARPAPRSRAPNRRAPAKTTATNARQARHQVSGRTGRIGRGAHLPDGTKATEGTFRLEALVVRPAKAEGKLPIALITHGKNLKAEENQQLRADLYAPQARDFAARGWLSVVVIRRGYGESDGIPGVSRGAAYMSCQNADLVRGFDIEADDLDAALR